MAFVGQTLTASFAVVMSIFLYNAESTNALVVALAAIALRAIGSTSRANPTLRTR